MNQDTASNVYDFPAREYGIQGRWPSPDPAGLAAVNPMAPQTWNRYAYVRNSPLESTDPTGMFAGPHGCLARVRRQNQGGCDYGSIDEDGGGDDGEEFDQEVLLGNGGPGFGDLYGNTIFDAIQGAPGTFVTWTPGQAGFSFGFSISAWYSAMAAHDAQLLANSREAYYNQLGATVTALQAMGATSDQIQAFIEANPFNPDTVELEGGNFDFANPADKFGNYVFDFGCAEERCDEDGLGTLDFSHNDGTFHLDTADPFNFPGGTFLHLGVDLLLGNIYYFAIPR